IKILHDDDILKGNCLQVLAEIAQQHRDVVSISCACEVFVGRQLVRPFLRLDRPLLERIEPGDALLAMYILDEACWARPTQQMIHRSVIEDGILFETTAGIQTLQDSWFNARVHMKGPALVYNAPLVEWHQGHESVTSTTKEEQFAEEFVAFRKIVFSLVPNDKSPPSVRSVEGMVILVRSLTNLRNKRYRAAMRMMFRVWSFRAYGLALRW